MSSVGITKADGWRGLIERELSSYLNVYRVSLDTAKRSIVKKHGGNPATLAIGVSKTIRELGPGEPSVNLLARIVAVYEKEVTPQGQETKTILSFGTSSSGMNDWSAARIA